MSNRKIILVVDDSVPNLQLCRGLLKDEFDVRMAMSGTMALESLEKLRPDVILLDIEMPDMSGFEVMAEINRRPELKGIPVIFVTSHASEKLVAKALRYKAAGYLLKPFEANLLYAKIHSVLKVVPQRSPGKPSTTRTDITPKQKRQIIMLVDDNPINLTMGKNMLKDFYEVFTFPSAEMLFKFLEAVTPDLILLDILMLDMNGYEVIKILKADARYADIPVIFVTSKNTEGDELKGLDLGAVDYVTKPFSATILLKRIENHLLTRKMAEASEAETRTKLMLDGTPLMCTLRDERNHVIDCNQEAAHVFFGATERNASGGNFSRFYPEFQPDGRRSVDKAGEILNDLLDNGSIDRFEWTYLTADGIAFPAEVKLVLIPWENTYRIVSYARDLREIKANERQIRENLQRNHRLEMRQETTKVASETRNRFLTLISREIRSPVNVILGLLDLMRTDNLDAQQSRHLDDVKRTSEALLRIVNDILDFHKFESGERHDFVHAFDSDKAAVGTLEKLMREVQLTSENLYRSERNPPPSS